ncbi:MAG: RNA polymerase sigma factor [Bacteroidia bacterium]
MELHTALAPSDPDQRREVFDKLILRYQKPLYYFILRYTREPYVTEDLVQETFLQAWIKWDTFKGDSSFKTWLFKIGIRLTLKYLSGKPRVLPLEETLAAEEASWDMPPAEEITALLQEALQTLPPKQRKIFEAIYFQNQKYAQVASEFCIRENTARAHFHWAKEKIWAFLRGRLLALRM